MREGEMSQWDCNEERALEHAPLDECIPSLLSVSLGGNGVSEEGKTLESGINWDTHTHTHTHTHSFSPEEHLPWELLPLCRIGDK